jgi:hypothetical protein
MMALDPKRAISILSSEGISLSEWHVLCLVGMWPIPAARAAMTAASHSSEDWLGSVSVAACKKALDECLAKRWLRVVAATWIRELRGLVKGRFVGPIYGYPSSGDIDFTPRGARIYKRLSALLLGSAWRASHVYQAEIGAKSRFFFRTRKATVKAVRQWRLHRCVLTTSPIISIGPWCVYWWDRYSRGYYVDVRFSVSAKPG